MKPNKIIFLTFFVFLFSMDGFAQIEVKDDLKAFQILESQESVKNVSNNPRVTGNQIFIEQVGRDNVINFEIVASKSEVRYNQNGEGNVIDASIMANTYNSEIFQNGSDNRIIDEITSSTDNVVLNLTQDGQFQNFERYGSNSIGDKLEFNMSGNFNSLIVRNYK